MSNNIVAILGEELVQSEGEVAQTNSVIVNPESSVITVRASSRQHEEIQKYLDLVMTNVRRQVLIEATIVEVLLDDRYQGGVDWQRLASGAGFMVSQTLLGGFTGAVGAATTTGLVLNYNDAADEEIDITLRLLQEFGETRVLSSPKLMTLNNQTAILKVVDNEVYFTLELQEDENENGTEDLTLTTTVNTVAVGLIMNVTPQISEHDAVTLNIRPTISRIREFVQDPSVQIIAARVAGNLNTPITNRVPVVQVRETENTLKVGSGQIAVLGGLMQDNFVRDTDQIPGLGDLGDVGEAFEFNSRNFRKSELVVFMRPWVIRNPDVSGDLRSFESLLPENHEYQEPLKTLRPELTGE